MRDNPSRRDKWPAYRPTRHVLILRRRRYERPWQGYVVDWKHHSYKWEALVVYQDETLDGSPLVWKWFPVKQLRPLYPDPNARDAEFYEGRPAVGAVAETARSLTDQLSRSTLSRD